MANQGKPVDSEKLILFGDDLIGVLTDKKGAEALIQSCDSAFTIFSSFFSSSRDVRSSIEDYEQKIDACKKEIEKVKSETLSASELERIQNELEQIGKKERSLIEELSTVVNKKTEELDQQKASVEKKKNTMRKRDDDMLKARELLSMCASITKIVPDVHDQENISGYTVDKNKTRVDRFEFQKSESSFDVCQKLWKMTSD